MIKKIILICFLALGILKADTLVKKKRGFGFSLGLMGYGISYFDKDRNTEIFGSFLGYDDYAEGSNYNFDDEQSEMHISLHYRKFFKEGVGGFYYGGFARYSYLDGKLKGEHKRAEQNKFGIGGEVGYTSFGLLEYPTLYWGLGFGLGAYFNKESEIYESDEILGDFPLIIHLDLIRIGLVF